MLAITAVTAVKINGLYAMVILTAVNNLTKLNKNFRGLSHL